MVDFVVTEKNVNELFTSLDVVFNQQYSVVDRLKNAAFGYVFCSVTQPLPASSSLSACISIVSMYRKKVYSLNNENLLVKAHRKTSKDKHHTLSNTWYS